MAVWTPPRTWTPGEFVTGLMMNTHIRDNLIHVYDRINALAPASGDVVINATKKLYLDGGSDTWIDEDIANQIRFVAGGSTSFLARADGIAIPALDKLYLDGGNNTYLYEEAADTVSVVTGGTRRFQIGSTSVTFESGIASITIAGASALLDLTGATAPEIRFNTNANGRIFANQSLIFGIDRDNTATSEAFYWRINNLTDVMQLNESGYLALNVTPSYRFQIRENRDSWTVYIDNLHANPYGYKVDYANSSPNSTLSDAFHFSDNIAVRAKLVSNGGWHNYSANNVNLSDMNWKERLTISQSNRQKIADITMYRGRYKGTKRKSLDVMWLAQDIQKIEPDWVEVFDHKTGALGTRDHVIFMAAVGVVGDHERDIQSLFKAVEPMEKYGTKIAALEKRVAKLEKAA